MFLINSVGIHQGGGLRILNGLLKSISSEVTVVLDARVNPSDLPAFNNISYMKARKGLVGRLLLEFQLVRGNYSKFISLNSLPFLFHRTDILYFHNLSIIHKPWTSLQKLMLFTLLFRVRTVIVQTKYTKSILSQFTRRGNILVEKLYDGRQTILEDTKLYDFFYPCSIENHKNLDNVLDAWKLLAVNNIFPHLGLTLPKIFDVKLKMIENDHPGLRITNLGWLTEDSVSQTIGLSNFLLFASDYESLGLPLCDAEASGLRIISSAEEYVFEVCRPVRTFNQKSAVSIAHAVAAELGYSIHRINRDDYSFSLAEMIEQDK